MSSHAAQLQSYNNELVKCIDSLRSHLSSLSQQINQEESYKSIIQSELATWTNNLNNVEDSLSRKYQVKEDLEKCLKETEDAYAKIIESSQTLLQVLKRETTTLSQSISSISPFPKPQPTSTKVIIPDFGSYVPSNTHLSQNTHKR